MLSHSYSSCKWLTYTDLIAMLTICFFALFSANKFTNRTSKAENHLPRQIDSIYFLVPFYAGSDSCGWFMTLRMLPKLLRAKLGGIYEQSLRMCFVMTTLS